MSPIRFPSGFALITIFIPIFIISCAARPVPISPEKSTPSILLVASQGGIVDGRGRFREIFRDVLSAASPKTQTGEPWDDATKLWKLADEPPPTGKPAPSGPSRGTFRVVIVPGLLAECVAEKSTAFSDARERLEEIGYKTDYIQTRGRKGSSSNAELIRHAVTGMPTDEMVIFVTHSKGTVDTLEALVKYPSLAVRTAALISVSGAVNGSPLADAFPEFLLKLAHEIPISSCSPGENIEAVNSLRRSTRISWLSTHQLPRSVRYYSLAAFTLRQNTSRILRPFYDILARTEPINDSLVICSDAIIPGSVLLGYPNADHLAVAMPFDRRISQTLAWLIDENDYPRAALLEAAVRFAEEDLAAAGTSPLSE